MSIIELRRANQLRANKNTFFHIIILDSARYEKNGKDIFYLRQNSVSISLVRSSIFDEINYINGA